MELVNMEYTSQLTENSFAELLKNNTDRDKALRYTTTGIHKDDIEFRIAGYPIKKFGSQGQQKSFVVAIKLAQFEYIRLTKGFKPILLFDDVFDKLDPSRVHQILQLVSENSFGQVFITDTQPERIQSIFKQISIEHKVFEVKDHQLKQIHA
jgi:DNA replication and repair protein RecF